MRAARFACAQLGPACAQHRRYACRLRVPAARQNCSHVMAPASSLSRRACVHYRLFADTPGCMHALWCACVQSRPACIRVPGPRALRAERMQLLRACMQAGLYPCDDLRARVQRRLTACGPACVHADSPASLHVKVFACTARERVAYCRKIEGPDRRMNARTSATKGSLLRTPGPASYTQVGRALY